MQEQRERNVQVGAGATTEAFVAMREARDKTLGMPKLIIPSIHVNMRAGRPPEPDESGTTVLKLPVTVL